MPQPLDHAVIAVRDLDSAARDYGALGFTVVPGGRHANRATHNALITFADGTYLELLAATGEPPVPGGVDFGVLLRQGEGLVGFALRSDNLEADSARLRAEGFDCGEIIPGERRRPDGTVIAWKLALLDGGFAPFLIQDVTPRGWRIPIDPGIATHANRVTGFRAIEIASCDLALSALRYRRVFGPVSAELVMLREAGPGSDCPESLYALHLAWDQREFPPDQTHGVRFR